MHHQNKDFKFFLGCSVILHLLLFIVVNFNFERKTIHQEQAIAIDFLEIQDKSNVVNQTKVVEKKDVAETKEKLQESYKEPTKEEKAPEIVKEQKQHKKEENIREKPTPLKEKNSNAEPKKEEPKKEEPKKTQEKKPIEQKSEKLKELDELESMLKNLEKKNLNYRKGESEMRGSGNENMKMAYTDFDAIVSQIEKHWNLSHITGKQGDKIKIVLKVELSEQGFVENIEVVKTLCQNQDRLCMIATENAIRAVQIASPFQFLKREHYTYWRSIVITFDPSHVQ